jgi:hypothetical protein
LGYVGARLGSRKRFVDTPAGGDRIPYGRTLPDELADVSLFSAGHLSTQSPKNGLFVGKLRGVKPERWRRTCLCGRDAARLDPEDRRDGAPLVVLTPLSRVEGADTHASARGEGLLRRLRARPVAGRCHL